MALPFRFQLCSACQWFDFPFIDQLDIASRVCSLVAPSKTTESMQFPVLGASAIFELHSTDGRVEMWLRDVADMGASGWSVRMVDVGDFFLGTHVRFPDGVVVV
jgi:hypothetical protein